MNSLILLLLAGHGGVLTPAADGGLWLVDRQNDQLWLDRGGTQTAWQTDPWPQAVAVDFTSRPVVTCREAGTLVRLGADGGVDRLSLPGGPGPLAITSDGRQALVGLRDAPKAVLIDLEAWTIAREVELPAAPVDVALSGQWGAALLGDGGALVRFPLAGDAGVSQALPPAPRTRGVMLAHDGRALIAVVRTSKGESVKEGLFDYGASTLDGKRLDRWKYYHRVVPGGLLRVNDLLGVVAFDDGTLAEFSVTFSNTACDLRDQWRLEGFVRQGARWVGFSPLQRALVSLERRDLGRPSTNPGWLEVVGVRKLPDGARAKELLRGERLFSIESSATSYLGFSCETCHPDGRSDGLRWRLSGKEAVPTLDARGTARDERWLQRHAVQLGGEGFSTEDVSALARYLREGFRASR